METKEILIKARELISTPEKWGKDYAWRRPDDTFCASQAIAKAGVNEDAFTALAIAIDRRGAAAPVSTIINFNDAPKTTHADVLAAFDTAIASCQ